MHCWLTGRNVVYTTPVAKWRGKMGHGFLVFQLLANAKLTYAEWTLKSCSAAAVIAAVGFVGCKSERERKDTPIRCGARSVINRRDRNTLRTQMKPHALSSPRCVKGAKFGMQRLWVLSPAGCNIMFYMHSQKSLICLSALTEVAQSPLSKYEGGMRNIYIFNSPGTQIIIASFSTIICLCINQHTYCKCKTWCVISVVHCDSSKIASFPIHQTNLTQMQNRALHNAICFA